MTCIDSVASRLQFSGRGSTGRPLTISCVLPIRSESEVRSSIAGPIADIRDRPVSGSQNTSGVLVFGCLNASATFTKARGPCPSRGVATPRQGVLRQSEPQTRPPSSARASERSRLADSRPMGGARSRGRGSSVQASFTISQLQRGRGPLRMRRCRRTRSQPLFHWR